MSLLAKSVGAHPSNSRRTRRLLVCRRTPRAPGGGDERCELYTVVRQPIDYAEPIRERDGSAVDVGARSKLKQILQRARVAQIF
jgi:hypothetical protein